MPVVGAIEDAARLANLLASGLRATVGGIGHSDDQLVRLAVFDDVGDVERERIRSTFVLAEELAVDKHPRLPIDSLEVEEGPAGLRSRRDLAAIPNGCTLRHHLVDARELRFDWVGHLDLAVEGRRSLRLADDEVPRSVEVDPTIALELGPWILGPRGRCGLCRLCPSGCPSRRRIHRLNSSQSEDRSKCKCPHERQFNRSPPTLDSESCVKQACGCRCSLIWSSTLGSKT